VNHYYEAVLFCPSKTIFGEVDYVYLLSDGSSPLPWASIYFSQSVLTKAQKKIRDEFLVRNSKKLHMAIFQGIGCQLHNSAMLK
jgi:hypothetical protein